MRFSLLALYALLLCAAAGAAGLPRGLLLIGYDGSAWHPYVANNAGHLQKVTAVVDPAEVSWQAADQLLYVKGNDGGRYRYSLLSGERRELAADQHAYTQLRASADQVLMVRLQNGRSNATELVAWPGTTAASEHVLQQIAAEFHPYRLDHNLYYAVVSCRLGCNHVIQDVWQKDLRSGYARQLTMLNAVSYLHSVDAEQRYGFISSNAQGYYHIARLDLQQSDLQWLTDGEVTDSDPSLSAKGDLYFLRRSSAGTVLMRMPGVLSRELPAASSAQPVPLPAGIKKIRYLEIAP